MTTQAEALKKIKALVIGDLLPNWANFDAISNTRSAIADLCDAGLATVSDAQPVVPDDATYGKNGPIDANRLEEIAKERPDECFLKGSGVLKLLGAIRRLERETRHAAEPQGFISVKDQPPAQDGQDCVIWEDPDTPHLLPATWSAARGHFDTKCGWFDATEVAYWMPVQPIAVTPKEPTNEHRTG